MMQRAEQAAEVRGKSDEQLAEEARKGSSSAQDQILQKYKALVLARARLYFMLGADRDDVVQEGMIGLFDAVNSFDPARGTFSAFAQLCIDRRIMSAVRSAGRLKNVPLNEYVSLSSPLADGETLLAESLPAGDDSDPETLAIFSELKERLHGSGLLSAFESEVLSLVEQGLTASDIAVRTGRTAKAVDNASQRIRRKLQKLLT